MVYLLN